MLYSMVFISILSVIFFALGVFYEPKSYVNIGTLLAAILSSAMLYEQIKRKNTNNDALVLHNKRIFSKSWEHLRYSFFRDEFISPAIIMDLQGWISDSGSQIVSICVNGANNSNKYHCEFEIKKNENVYPTIIYKFDDGYFSYRYIGSSNGIHVLMTIENGGGSGHFFNVMLVTLEEDEELSFYDGVTVSNRVCITRLGFISLGDRFDGTVCVIGNKLKISGKNIESEVVDDFEIQLMQGQDSH